MRVTDIVYYSPPYGSVRNLENYKKWFYKTLYEHWKNNKDKFPEYTVNLKKREWSPEDIENWFKRPDGEFPGGLTYALVDLMANEMQGCCGNCKHFVQSEKDKERKATGGVCGVYDKGGMVVMHPYGDVRSTLHWRLPERSVSKLSMQICSGFQPREDGMWYTIKKKRKE